MARTLYSARYIESARCVRFISAGFRVLAVCVGLLLSLMSDRSSSRHLQPLLGRVYGRHDIYLLPALQKAT